MNMSIIISQEISKKKRTLVEQIHRGGKLSRKEKKTTKYARICSMIKCTLTKETIHI